MSLYPPPGRFQTDSRGGDARGREGKEPALSTMLSLHGRE